MSNVICGITRTIIIYQYMTFPYGFYQANFSSYTDLRSLCKTWCIGWVPPPPPLNSGDKLENVDYEINNHLEINFSCKIL